LPLAAGAHTLALVSWQRESGGGVQQTETEDRLLARLRAGDEAAFSALIDGYHASMVRIAQTYVHTRAVAEEVAQEAWLGVLKGLDSFEGRSSLRTWIFRILVNIARTRSKRESRSVPFSSVAPADDDGPAVEPDRFQGPADPNPGAWSEPPRSWEGVPEERLLSKEVRAVIEQAIETLPESQRSVIVLRDVDGWSPEEVCNVLSISETNHRVLLHRARSKVRRALEQYFDQELGA
jgi:RNA polymerase sigma-70 factor (ECF subfamily)